MAKTVRLWEDVLKGLNSIAAGNNSSRSIGDMEDLISKLSSSSQQHKTAWKKLLKQMQVRVAVQADTAACLHSCRRRVCVLACA
jgi:hypothetical protein